MGLGVGDDAGHLDSQGHNLPCGQSQLNPHLTFGAGF